MSDQSVDDLVVVAENLKVSRWAHAVKDCSNRWGGGEARRCDMCFCYVCDTVLDECDDQQAHLEADGAVEEWRRAKRRRRAVLATAWDDIDGLVDALVGLAVAEAQPAATRAAAQARAQAQAQRQTVVRSGGMEAGMGEVGLEASVIEVGSSPTFVWCVDRFGEQDGGLQGGVDAGKVELEGVDVSLAVADVVVRVEGDGETVGRADLVKEEDGGSGSGRWELRDEAERKGTSWNGQDDRKIG